MGFGEREPEPVKQLKTETESYFGRGKPFKYA